MSRNASIIEARTVNSQISTEGEGQTKDLKRGDNKDIRRILGSDYSDQFRSAYDTVDLIRFHEAVRDDGILAACLDFLIQFMLGDHFKTIIDVNTEFDTEEEQKAALDKFAANPIIRRYKKKIDQINRELKFQTHLFSLLFQAFTFGRACGLVEKSPIDNLPAAIKVLPSMHLGKVFVHPRTWEVLGVEHNDFKFPASIIRSDEMMYFTIRDHNLSPGTLHYGYSLVERVVDLSELNRINNQRNLKEINYRMWAAFLLIRLVGSYNEKTMRKVKDQIAKGAGNSIMVNQQVTVEVHRVVHDMVQLLDERKENYRETIRQMQVPIILFDPDILNRATSQELIEAWTASVLRNYRSWLKDIIQDQWINPIVKELIEADRRPSIGQQEEEQPPLIQEGPNTSSSPNLNEEKEETSTRTSNRDIVPIEAINPQTNEVHVYRLPWKIKIEFAPLNYDTFKERAEMAILLKNNGMATIRTGLKLMGIEDEEEIAALVELEEKRQEQRFSQGQQPFPQENRQRSLERQRETMKQELQKSVTGQNVPSKGIIRPSRTAPEE